MLSRNQVDVSVYQSALLFIYFSYCFLSLSLSLSLSRSLSYMYLCKKLFVAVLVQWGTEGYDNEWI